MRISKQHALSQKKEKTQRRDIRTEFRCLKNENTKERHSHRISLLKEWDEHLMTPSTT